MRAGLTAIIMATAGLGGCARPMPAADSVVALRGSPLDIDVLKNDRDPNERPLIIGRVWGAKKGEVSINADNTVRYTPKADASGEDAFHYRIKNNRGRGKIGNVHVKIVEPLPGAVLVTAPSNSAAPGTIVKRELGPAASGHPVSDAFIQALSITFFTREDDKDLNEPIQITVRRNQEVLAERAAGSGVVWAPNSVRIEEVMLTRAIPLADASSVAVEIRKAAAGPGAGGSWVMQIDVQGRLSDGGTVSVIPKSLAFQFGGGSSNTRGWTLAPPASRPATKP